MQHPELPLFAFITAFLVLIPLSWCWRTRNIAMLALIAWFFVVDVIFGINSLVWAGNVDNLIPVWCDITSKIVIGATFALPLATLCICKHMEAVSSLRKAHFDSADRRRRIILESILCFGVPLIFMALHYIVQGHRFDIFENTGCQATLYISIPGVLLMYFPPLLFSVITLIYAVFALHHFVHRRLTIAAHLQNSNPALTTHQYLRLIAMAVTEMIWGTVFTAYNLYSNVAPGLRPWTNWADVHSKFSRVDLFPASTIPPDFLSSMMFLWWAMPASSIIFFLFFAFSEEVMKDYHKAWAWFKKTILRRKAETASILTPSIRRSGIHPLHIVDLKNLNINKKQSNSAITVSSFTITAPSPRKADEADNHSLASSTPSYEAHSTNPIRALQSPYPQSIIISMSERYRESQLPSPTMSFPSSVRDYPTPYEVPISSYHPPFNPPGIFSVPSPRVRPEEGIVVTIHRQASVDNIV